MSLFDRWMSSLGVSKSSLDQSKLVNQSGVPRRSPKGHSSSDSEDDRPSTPSHKSYPSTESQASLKAPLLQPSQESRIVRAGPQAHRRRTLVPSYLDSGDEEPDDLRSESIIVTAKGRISTGPSRRHPFERANVLTDNAPHPIPNKTRSNGRFFQQGPLTIDQIRNLFWVEEIAPEDHYPQTARTLNIFRQRKRHCDVRLVVDAGRYYAHKAVLVSASQDLQNRLEASSLWKTGKMSVDLSNLGFENVAMELVINWMYTGAIRCNIRDNFERLLTVAEGLKIPRLTKICQKLSISTAATSPAVVPVVGTSIVANVLSRFISNTPPQNSERSRSIKSPAQKWASFSDVVESDEYLRWPVEKVIAFLSSDSLKIKSERQIYQAALQWINDVELSRIGHLDGLLNCVRWLHITPQDIVDIKHLDPQLFSAPAVSGKAAVGQWQRDLMQRGINLPANSQLANRCQIAT